MGDSSTEILRSFFEVEKDRVTRTRSKNKKTSYNA